MTPTTLDTFTSPATDADTGLREGFAEVGDVELHYVEAGDGPLVVLLHGFPEFWYGWRQQIAPLVKAGFRVVAPDLRGYNLSSQPDGFAAYGRQAGRRRPRSHPRARCRVRDGGRSRLGRNRRVDPGDESPGGRRPPRHPERGPSAPAERRTAQPCVSS
jgi:pimeloyl-ACP methyl ester carboxylesterase